MYIYPVFLLACTRYFDQSYLDPMTWLTAQRWKLHVIPKIVVIRIRDIPSFGITNPQPYCEGGYQPFAAMANVTRKYAAVPSFVGERID